MDYYPLSANIKRKAMHCVRQLISLSDSDGKINYW